MQGAGRVAVVLVVALACPPAGARALPSYEDAAPIPQQVDASASWGRVVGLAANQKVRLRVDPGPRTVKGRFASADADSITVLVKGARERFPRDTVLEVKAVHKGREHFQLLGGLAVAGAGALLLTGSIGQARDVSAGRVPEESDLTLFLPAISAGFGGVVAVLGNYRPVYDRRKP